MTFPTVYYYSCCEVNRNILYQKRECFTTHNILIGHEQVEALLESISRQYKS
jgi:hypothetical protein